MDDVGVKGRRVLLILVARAIAGVIVALVWPREREPEYQGKRLNEWLAAYELGYISVTEQRFADDERAAAAKAIRNLGTNCLPWLVRWIAYEPPGWRDRYRGILWRLPMPIRLRLWEDDRLSMHAVEAFRILGPEAGPAVPELAGLMNDSSPNIHRWRAMLALSGIGKDGFPPLLAVLSNRVGGEFRAAKGILELFRAGVDISPAVPAMLLMDRDFRKTNVVSNLEDPVYYVSVLAEKPSLLIPALTNCLSDPRSDVRWEAMRELGLFGDRAVDAVPALKGMLADPDRSVREEATNAVRKIAPDMLGAVEHRQIQGDVGKSETNPLPDNTWVVRRFSRS